MLCALFNEQLQAFVSLWVGGGLRAIDIGDVTAGRYAATVGPQGSD